MLVVSYFHKVLEETAVGFSDALYLLGVPHRLEWCESRELSGKGAVYIVVGVHHYKKLPRWYVAVQTEQHSSDWVTPRFEGKLKRAIAVVDFSKFQSRKWKCRRSFFVSTRIPLAIFFGDGQDGPKDDPKDIDVLFFGGPHERRFKMKGLFERLALEKNIKVLFLVCGEAQFVYDEERDALVDRAKVVLNVHFWPDAALETHRIEYLMSRGACVLSERSCDAVLDAGYVGAVQFTSFENMPRDAMRLLSDSKLRDRASRKAWELSRKHQFDLRPLQHAVRESLQHVLTCR